MAVFQFQMSVALNSVQWQTVYPMDFYANDSLGAWTNNNEAHRPVRQKKTKPVKITTKGDNQITTKGDNLEAVINVGNSGDANKTEECQRMGSKSVVQTENKQSEGPDMNPCSDNKSSCQPGCCLDDKIK